MLVYRHAAGEQRQTAEVPEVVMPELTMNVGQQFDSQVHRDAGLIRPWPDCRYSWPTHIELTTEQYRYTLAQITCPACLAVKP